MRSLFCDFPEHFDPRQDGRLNVQVGSLPCLCADFEQELLLFWRGDDEDGIINRAPELLRVYSTWATECLVAHTASAGCRVAHPPVVAGHTFRTIGFATGSAPFRVIHTGAVESITGTCVTITRNWLKEGVSVVAASRAETSTLFLGTRELLSAQCRWRVPLFHPLPSL